MKARLTATVAALLLTVVTFGSAQDDTRTSDRYESESRFLEEMSSDMERLGALLGGVLDAGEKEGFDPQPDPPSYGDLLPAVREMIEICNAMVGDPIPWVGDPFVGDPFIGDERILEIRKLLQEIQDLLLQAERGGMTDEIRARMAVDMFRILRLLEEMKSQPLPAGDLK